MIIGAFQDGETGGFTMGNIEALRSPAALDTLRKSVLLAGSTALLGGVLGAVLSYLIVSLGERSVLRRATLSLAGVLAQFGGVTPAFARISLLGFSGLLTEALGGWVYGSGWLYGLNGLIVVYTYFQVPLMVIVFTPAIEGLRPQLREAAVNLGATPCSTGGWSGSRCSRRRSSGRCCCCSPTCVRGLRHGRRPGQPGATRSSRC
ncbi:hypothetical protein [Nocardioides sp. B-3]|uniref:hypothetical protein n=1 Tax=Nocardioides sp. B-3 TaxID=2895565 RepID=UPI00215322EC|nr:hypothetical protein [Nocardioides sp. B-3]UUZ57732.1 hypothetical protein LP418_14990 [Nocardioides sp. B-3]